MTTAVDILKGIYTEANFTSYLIYFFWILLLVIYWYSALYDKINGLTQKRIRTGINYPLTIYILFIVTLVVQYHSLHKRYIWEFPGNETIWFLLGVVMMVVGIYIIGWARACLAGYWGTDIYDYGQSDELVIKGIYKKIRHPVYLGQSLMTTGTVFMFNNLWLLFFPIVTTIVNIVRAMREDLDLAKRFGKEFDDYKARTGFWGML